MLGASAVGCDAVRKQERHALRPVGARGEAKLVLEHLPGRRVSGRETTVPRSAVARSQAIAEEQLEVVILRLEMAVVEGLLIVRIGAGLEQQARELEGRAGALAASAHPRRRRTRR